MAKIVLKGKSASAKIETAFEEFIRYCKAKNLSPATIHDYQREFKGFHNFYDGSIQGISQTTIIEFIEYLQERGVSPFTVNHALRHLRAILNFWAEQGYIKPIKLKLLKVTEKIMETYTDDEIVKLLKKPDLKNCSFRDLRTWAVINFLVGTGCRLGTLVNVKIGEIDWENGMIAYSHTKNKKVQYIPMSRQLEIVLREYLSNWDGEADDYLFPSENNTQLLTTSVARSIARYNRKRGVTKTSAHLFRHTFAKNWILQGGDPLRLQKVLGHSTLTMAQHYANLYKQDLKHNFDSFNLLSRLKTDKIKLGKVAGGAK